MAQLSSPGVSVTVIDESFYTPAAPGTVPLIIVASQQDKQNAAGTGIAPGTLAANAGKVWLLTSQLDLGNTFGVPVFETDAENNPVNAGEVNEYGLQAAYSFLGVANRAYVVRADVDLTKLESSGVAPSGDPDDGTMWFDIATTDFGIFEWNSAAATVTNGQTFAHQDIPVITDSTKVTGGGAPIASYGALGEYALVSTATDGTKTLWLKKYNTANADAAVASNAGTWVQVGTTTWTASWPTASSTTAATLVVGDTFTINIGAGPVTVANATTTAALATNINTAAIAGVTAASISGVLYVYSTGTTVTLGGTGFGKLGFSTSAYYAPKLTISPHYSVPQYGTYQVASSANGYPSGSVWVKSTPVNQGANWDVRTYNSNTMRWIKQSIKSLYPTPEAAMAVLDPKGGGINIPVGDIFVKYNDKEATPAIGSFRIYKRMTTGSTTARSIVIAASTFTAGANGFSISETGIGTSTLITHSAVSFTAAGTTADGATLVTALNNVLPGSKVIAVLNSDNSITISHTAGGDIRLVDGANTPLYKLFNSGTGSFYADPSSNGSDGKYIITGWSAVISGGTSVVTTSLNAPTSVPADGTLWYNGSTSDVDIMINDGTAWRGFLTVQGKAVNQIGGSGTTDANGPIISATKPKTQSDGTTILAHGDLWLDASNLENWPTIYKYDFLNKKWNLLDNTDQVSQNGVVFADARWADESNNPAGAKAGAGDADSIVKLLSTNYTDGDAPDPAVYPRGILLYNLRRSSFNVKQYHAGYIDTNASNARMSNSAQTLYYPDRWITAAANDHLGVGRFGRKAQRQVVVQSLNALIGSNQPIRDEDSRTFNLISCPGYLETLPALTDLNNSRGLLSFIVADAPARLTPDATTLGDWSQNVGLATGDGEDGLISTDANAAVYYPWGYTTDLKGNNVVVPPSHMMLRTIALSDNVSYPWFAPAGVRRGGITNASSVGYVDGQSGEFITVALNTGQRDTLQLNHVNPITYLGGVGLVAYGQKTRQLVASALDRINVARLVIYLRYQLNAIAKPYIFEPNDTITRNELKQQIEKLLLELTGERALYDYLVVCDTSNNTPARIDANELHVDIAIEPVKAVEFIYIPLRLENTGAIKGLGQ